jgi:hypothetical protein
VGAGARDVIGGAAACPGADVGARDEVEEKTPEGVPKRVVAWKAGGGGKAGEEDG